MHAMKKIIFRKQFTVAARHLARCAGLVLLSLLVTGCPASKSEQPEVMSQGKVVIRGSNTIGEELAPRLIEEFKKSNPSAEFDLESKGTGYGLGNLLVGGCDLAAASRPTTTNEVVMARDRGVELNEHIIGSYAVAIAVHPGNPLTSLTREQVRDIFTGIIKNWNELGGPDAAIHLYIRDPISGTYLGFQEIAMENKPYSLEVKTFTSYDAVTKAIAQDPHGIGYTSVELAATPAVKGLAIGEASPTFKSVHDGIYPYARQLRFYTAKGRETQLAMQFVQFIQSDKGRVVLEEMGYVPKP